MLPKRFTFPFCYQPHPLSLLAVKALQQQIESHQLLQPLFTQMGKMLGVLVVENPQNALGYLVAFSGKLSVSDFGVKNAIHFVPAIVEHDDQAHW